MTNEEINKLILDNQNIAYKILNNHANSIKSLIDYDELKSICLLGLTKAANTFDISKGYTFSTYAYKVITNDIYYELRKCKKYRNTISTETLLANTDNDMEKLTFSDLLKSDIDIEDEVITKVNIDTLKKHINDLPDSLKIIVNYRLQGLTQSEIANILNVSQPQVSILFTEALNFLRYKYKYNKEEF